MNCVCIASFASWLLSGARAGPEGNRSVTLASYLNFIAAIASVKYILDSTAAISETGRVHSGFIQLLHVSESRPGGSGQRSAIKSGRGNAPPTEQVWHQPLLLLSSLL